LSLKNLSRLVLLTKLLIFGSPVSAEDYQIYFKTSPRPELLRPFSDPATLTLLVTNADGKPVQRGWAEVRLDAPKPNRFFSTDFPLIEGSQLLEMQLPLSRGRGEWKYLFPVRGNYRISIDYVTAEGVRTSKTFDVTIREKREKWFFLGTFTVALFLCGFAAGRIFTSSPVRAQQTAAFVVMFCWALTLIKPAAAADGPAGAYFGWLETAPAEVGKPGAIRWRLGGGAAKDQSVALLTLTVTHREKQKVVFSVERIPVAGEFGANLHYPDGGEYRVAAIASVVGRPALRTERTVSVTAVEPPTKTMLPALVFFLAVIAAGLGAGRWTKRHRIRD
jgi:hypothetical protein